jgi:filamentous hemagglutinin family protein
MKLTALKNSRLRATTLYTSVSLLAVNAAFAASIGPTGEVVQTGNATFNRGTVNNTNINQTSRYVKIKWDTFDTSENHIVNFTQPTGGVALNRVTGGNATTFAGTLNAGGTVIIQNNHGITFTKSSVLNVGSLIATTANTLDNERFDGDGNLIGIAADGSAADGDITFGGTMELSPNGFAILAAPYISTEANTKPNSGIKANLGRIELASATKYTIDLQGDNLITYQVSEEDLRNIKSRTKLGVDNNADLKAEK